MVIIIISFTFTEKEDRKTQQADKRVGWWEADIQMGPEPMVWHW